MLINATLQALARDCLISSGAQVCKYTGSRETTDVWGVIEQRSQIVGADLGSVATDVWTIYFLNEEISDPHRGDRIKDEHGEVWLLYEQLEAANSYISNWSLIKV